MSFERERASGKHWICLIVRREKGAARQSTKCELTEFSSRHVHLLGNPFDRNDSLTTVNMPRFRISLCDWSTFLSRFLDWFEQSSMLYALEYFARRILGKVSVLDRLREVLLNLDPCDRCLWTSMLH